MDKTYFQVNLSVIILDKDRNILVAKRDENDDIYPGLWGIPGGKMEITDPSIEESVRREVREEVNVEVSELTLVSNNTRVHNDINKLFMVFTSTYKSGDPAPLEEMSEVRWFKFEELSKEMMTPFTYDIIANIFN